MKLIDINGKTNFFERRVSEYALHVKDADAGVSGGARGDGASADKCFACEDF
jgi:hypothetical protein